MHFDTNFAPRRFRIDRLVQTAVAGIALSACLLPSAYAQDAATTPAAPMAATTPMTASAVPMAATIDYTILADPRYSYHDIMRGRAYGLTNEQLGRAYAIAETADVPAGAVLDKLERGDTFVGIAQYYGVNLIKITDASEYSDKVANYVTAYEATGTGAQKMAMMSGGSMMPASTSMTPASTPMTASAAPMAPKDIVDTAIASGKFKMLVRALRAADLVDALKGPGPFTVFAPDDAAFKKIPKATRKSLMADKTQLANVLKYHVIPAKIDAAAAMAMTSPTSPATLEGDTLQVTSSNGTVKVNDATVIQADIQCSNGIIHVIDTVLMPPASATPAPAAPMTPATPPDTSTPATPAAPMAPAAPAAPMAPAAPAAPMAPAAPAAPAPQQ